ncbi:hypothetical protein D3C78_1020330 [compost metagenome]
MGIQQEWTPILTGSLTIWDFILAVSFPRQIAVILGVSLIRSCGVLVIGIEKVEKHLTGN